MRLRLVGKISLAFAVVTILLGIVTTWVGVRAIDQSVRQETQARMQYDLRIARLVLDGKIDQIRRRLIDVASNCDHLIGSPERLAVAIERERQNAELDYVCVTDARGVVLARSNGSTKIGDDLSVDPPVAAALENWLTLASVEVLPRERLLAEGGDLARRAHMVFKPTPRARPRPDTEQTSGMAVQAAVPVLAKGDHPPVLFLGGVLLNRNYAVVDRVQQLVFGDRTYEGQDVGSVTIFQWDVRISTNVKLENGNRAIETRVSREVHDLVLDSGRPWYGRAFVVNDWFLSAYEPIENYARKPIGILYVGTLEAPYKKARNDLVMQFGLVTAGGVTLVILISSLLARAFGKPLRDLAEGSERIAGGDLSTRVPVAQANDEIHDLAGAFNRMAESLAEEHRAFVHANDQLSEKNAALETLNRNYMEMLGFVSHELKSPLSSAVLSAQALHQGIGGALPEKQQRMVDILSRNLEYAVRMIQNYLDLSRIEKGELTLNLAAIDLRRDVVDPTVEDLKPAASAKRMQVLVETPSDLTIEADPHLLRIVFQNLIGNAIKYGREAGKVRIGCRVDDAYAIMHVWNEGVGVPAAKLNQLFTKFFRVRDPRLEKEKGTGLGLFITRDIVQRHGGDIRVESKEGQWINFIFRLPLTQPGNESAEG